MNIFRPVLDFLFPSRCRVCGAKDVALCGKCISSFRISHETGLKDVYSLFEYQEEPLRSLIWRMKYKNDRGLSESLGKILAEHVMEIEASEKDFLPGKRIIVPIPMHTDKARFFNHAEVMAKEIGKVLAAEVIPLLLYTRKTLRQASLKNKKRRMENIRESMGVIEKRAADFGGAQIILIDDITTTGATLAEARRALRAAGFKKIRTYTLAH